MAAGAGIDSPSGRRPNRPDGLSNPCSGAVDDLDADGAGRRSTQLARLLVLGGMGAGLTVAGVLTGAWTPAASADTPHIGAPQDRPSGQDNRERAQHEVKNTVRTGLFATTSKHAIHDRSDEGVHRARLRDSHIGLDGVEDDPATAAQTRRGLIHGRGVKHRDVAKSLAAAGTGAGATTPTTADEPRDLLTPAGTTTASLFGVTPTVPDGTGIAPADSTVVPAQGASAGITNVAERASPPTPIGADTVGSTGAGPTADSDVMRVGARAPVSLTRVDPGLSGVLDRSAAGSGALPTSGTAGVSSTSGPGDQTAGGDTVSAAGGGAGPGGTSGAGGSGTTRPDIPVLDDAPVTYQYIDGDFVVVPGERVAGRPVVRIARNPSGMSSFSVYGSSGDVDSSLLDVDMGRIEPGGSLLEDIMVRRGGEAPIRTNGEFRGIPVTRAALDRVRDEQASRDAAASGVFTVSTPEGEQLRFANVDLPTTTTFNPFTYETTDVVLPPRPGEASLTCITGDGCTYTFDDAGNLSVTRHITDENGARTTSRERREVRRPNEIPDSMPARSLTWVLDPGDGSFTAFPGIGDSTNPSTVALQVHRGPDGEVVAASTTGGGYPLSTDLSTDEPGPFPVLDPSLASTPGGRTWKTSAPDRADSLGAGENVAMGPDYFLTSDIDPATGEPRIRGGQLNDSLVGPMSNNTAQMFGWMAGIPNLAMPTNLAVDSNNPDANVTIDNSIRPGSLRVLANNSLSWTADDGETYRLDPSLYSAPATPGQVAQGTGTFRLQPDGSWAAVDPGEVPFVIARGWPEPPAEGGNAGADGGGRPPGGGPGRGDRPGGSPLVPAGGSPVGAGGGSSPASWRNGLAAPDVLARRANPETRRLIATIPDAQTTPRSTLTQPDPRAVSTSSVPVVAPSTSATAVPATRGTRADREPIGSPSAPREAVAPVAVGRVVALPEESPNNSAPTSGGGEAIPPQVNNRAAATPDPDGGNMPGGNGDGPFTPLRRSPRPGDRVTYMVYPGDADQPTRVLLSELNDETIDVPMPPSAIMLGFDVYDGHTETTITNGDGSDGREVLYAEPWLDELVAQIRTEDRTHREPNMMRGVRIGHELPVQDRRDRTLFPDTRREPSQAAVHLTCPDGTCVTLTGSGNVMFTPPGGPPEARIAFEPRGWTREPDGRLFLGEPPPPAFRRAGTPGAGGDPDGGPSGDGHRPVGHGGGGGGQPVSTDPTNPGLDSSPGDSTAGITATSTIPRRGGGNALTTGWAAGGGPVVRAEMFAQIAPDQAVTDPNTQLGRTPSASVADSPASGFTAVDPTVSTQQQILGRSPAAAYGDRSGAGTRDGSASTTPAPSNDPDRKPTPKSGDAASSSGGSGGGAPRDTVPAFLRNLGVRAGSAQQGGSSAGGGQDSGGGGSTDPQADGGGRGFPHVYQYDHSQGSSDTPPARTRPPLQVLAGTGADLLTSSASVGIDGSDVVVRPVVAPDGSSATAQLPAEVASPVFGDRPQGRSEIPTPAGSSNGDSLVVEPELLRPVSFDPGVEPMRPVGSTGTGELVEVPVVPRSGGRGSGAVAPSVVVDVAPSSVPSAAGLVAGVRGVAGFGVETAGNGLGEVVARPHLIEQGALEPTAEEENLAALLESRVSPAGIGPGAGLGDTLTFRTYNGMLSAGANGLVAGGPEVGGVAALMATPFSVLSAANQTLPGAQSRNDAAGDLARRAYLGMPGPVRDVIGGAGSLAVNAADAVSDGAASGALSDSTVGDLEMRMRVSEQAQRTEAFSTSIGHPINLAGASVSEVAHAYQYSGLAQMDEFRRTSSPSPLNLADVPAPNPADVRALSGGGLRTAQVGERVLVDAELSAESVRRSGFPLCGGAADVDCVPKDSFNVADPASRGKLRMGSGGVRSTDPVTGRVQEFPLCSTGRQQDCVPRDSIDPSNRNSVGTVRRGDGSPAYTDDSGRKVQYAECDVRGQFGCLQHGTHELVVGTGGPSVLDGAGRQLETVTVGDESMTPQELNRRLSTLPEYQPPPPVGAAGAGPVPNASPALQNPVEALVERVGDQVDAAADQAEKLPGGVGGAISWIRHHVPGFAGDGNPDR